MREFKEALFLCFEDKDSNLVNELIKNLIKFNKI